MHSFRLDEVYYPRIPEFRRKEEFFYELFAMNMRVFGSETGVMEYDFLEAISRLNSGMSFKHKGLSKGDLIQINGSVFECLWPPTVIDDERTLSDIRQALEDFERALEEDEETRQLYNRVREEGVFRDYLEGQGEKYAHGDYEEKGFRKFNYREAYTKPKRRRLPDVVRKANKSLRKAANHLSLALFEDNRFLFLGDAENFEIKQIVCDLKSKGREDFYVFITPHHGTHWNNSLRQIKCVYSVTSNGSKLCSKMKTQFKEISNRSLGTFTNSDIMIALHPVIVSPPMIPW